MRVRNILIGISIILGVIIGITAWYYTTSAPYSMQIITRPANPPGQPEMIQSLAEQRCVFLVTVAEREGWFQGMSGYGTAVTLSTKTPENMARVDLHPKAIKPGQIAEVTVIPTIASINETLILTITGDRQGLTQTVQLMINVLPGEDGLASYAVQMRDHFIPWLMAMHLELGITNRTQWTGTIVNPNILVVMHYLFYSDDWEMYVTWHVTIPPHDWTRIYLRQRYTEIQPSYAFEISSVTALSEPHPIAVPDWV